MLRVRTADGRRFRFARPFCIGRGEDCEVRIQDVGVSRTHVEVSFGDGAWWVRDLESRNGVLVDGQRLETASIEESLTIQLGTSGPLVALEVERAAAPTRRTPKPARHGRTRPDETELLAKYAERYFATAPGGEPVGDRTMMIRKAFRRVQATQKRRYAWSFGVLALAGLCAAGYAYYGHVRMRQQEATAENIFYTMKSQDVDIANLERAVAASGNTQVRQQVRSLRERRQQMETSYDGYLNGLRRYDRTRTPQERLILRVTRLFGECELAAPLGYVGEVQTYIRKWQSSDRYARTVSLAQQKGYTKRIVEALLDQNLPPQFFYLAMQESSFEPFASGPPTHKGIAKGMWQFVPETAVKYGLRPGPLLDLQRPDPLDDRHDWQKATLAAARYLKDIYATDAQASGLLVMASYNWGEHRVVNLLRSMPANPKARNFWQVLEKHRGTLPPETYDYVFHIVAAAAIGENPRLFGFPFDNPLGFLERR